MKDTTTAREEIEAELQELDYLHVWNNKQKDRVAYLEELLKELSE